jgi:hypothetical protein
MDLNTQRLFMGAAAETAPKLYVEDVFSTYLYTGNGSTQTITNGIDLSGEGGLVWIKQRSLANHHWLFDTARGVEKALASSLTNSESTRIGSVTSFGSSGFILGSDSAVNGTPETTASWTFRKAEKFFDVVTYTGNGSTQNITHSLGSTPGFIIIKRTDSTSNWICWHRALSAYNNDYMVLNNTSGVDTSNQFYPWSWNSTPPTSTQFSVGFNGGMNQAFGVNVSGGTYVAYVFAHDAGGFGDSGNDSVVSCGNFTTDGSGNATVTLGWEPQWILVKSTAVTGNWFLFDTMRGMPVSTSTASKDLNPNTSDAEGNGYPFQLSATGFGISSAGLSRAYIYIAIRRGPMKTPTVGTQVLHQLSRNGTGAETQVSGFGFPPDMMLTLWRSGGGSASQGSIIDKLRGNIPRLAPRSTAAEVTASSPTSYLALKSFDQNGVTYGQDQYSGYVNFNSSYLYMNYFFRRAPGFFDVVCFTGDGSANRSITHNLGVAPALYINRARSGTITHKWGVYASSLGLSQVLQLSSTAAATADNWWGSNSVTSTQYSVSGNDPAGNLAGSPYVTYLFATCPGVSKVGSYTGTGTTLNIDCGFAAGARFVMIKRTDSTGDWYVWDTARGISAGNDPYLLLNSTAAEVTNTDYIDPLSSGFQISSTAPAAINASGGSFIFLAIA